MKAATRFASTLFALLALALPASAKDEAPTLPPAGMAQLWTIGSVHVKKIDGKKPKRGPIVVAPGEHEFLVRTVADVYNGLGNTTTEQTFTVRARFDADRTYAWQTDGQGNLMYLTVMPEGFAMPNLGFFAASAEYLAAVQLAREQPRQDVTFIPMPPKE